MSLTRTIVGLVFLGCGIGVNHAAAQDAGDDSPPMAERRAHTLSMHGDVRIDPYYWLRERENSQVIDYLEAENRYVERELAETEGLRDKLFEEMKSRMKEDDQTVPYRDNGYWYVTRYEQGKQYPIYCRSESRSLAEVEIMLDVNEFAVGHEYCSVRGTQVSSGNDILACSVDLVGRRIYTLMFRDLTTGEWLDETIPNVTGNVAWANDNETIFYTRQDPETLRSFQVFRHQLGTNPDTDQLVYEETDETFRCRVSKTRSKRFIMIASTQTLSSEYRFLNADQPEQEPRILHPRERDLEYSVDHLGDHFYIRTNWQAENFRLMKTRIDATDKSNWEEVIGHREDTLLQQHLLFDDYLVLQQRRQGLTEIVFRAWDRDEPVSLEFPDPAYSARLTSNPETSTSQLRYRYTSLTTPGTTYEFDMQSHEQALLKQDEVQGGFDSQNYESVRLWAPARDGTQVPVSVVYRRGTSLDGSAPLLLYGYGSYGASMDASFSSDRLSLIDRGFVYAIAHVRGGQELGRHWYEDGKMFRKMNTFTDFIDVGEFLIQEGYADPERLYARGGSAGGLLIGAVVNLRPDLFHGVIADVPFVDVVTTMLDDSIPLTTNEYDEWGNPNVADEYAYMLSYSPYDNIRAVDYPNILVTTGLHDSQVQYWEPAKWVAKLRYEKTGENLVLFKTNMSAGHGGASGRFNRLRDMSLRYAFLLTLAGIEDQ